MNQQQQQAVAELLAEHQYVWISSALDPSPLPWSFTRQGWCWFLFFHVSVSCKCILKLPSRAPPHPPTPRRVHISSAAFLDKISQQTARPNRWTTASAFQRRLSGDIVHNTVNNSRKSISHNPAESVYQKKKRKKLKVQGCIRNLSQMFRKKKKKGKDKPECISTASYGWTGYWQHVTGREPWSMCNALHTLHATITALLTPTAHKLTLGNRCY